MSNVESREAMVRALSRFQAKVNEHPRLRTLLKGWDRDVRVECDDIDLRHGVRFRDTLIQDIAEDDGDADVPITMRASHAVLIDVFEGRRNPATLFLDGELQVFASDKDQTKLDAISLLLWD